MAANSIYLKQAKKDVLLTKEALLLALNDAKKNNNTGDIYLINSKLQELGIKVEQEQNDENKDVCSDEMYKKLVQSLFTVPEQKKQAKNYQVYSEYGSAKSYLRNLIIQLKKANTTDNDQVAHTVLDPENPKHKVIIKQIARAQFNIISFVMRQADDDEIIDDTDLSLFNGLFAVGFIERLKHYISLQYCNMQASGELDKLLDAVNCTKPTPDKLRGKIGKQ